MYIPEAEEGVKKDGIVAYLNIDKGYGFIEIQGYEKNIFFHARDMRGNNFSEIKRGDKVEVRDVIPTEKGFNAVEVKIIS